MRTKKNEERAKQISRNLQRKIWVFQKVRGGNLSIFCHICSFDFAIGHGGIKHVRNQIGGLMYTIYLLIRIKSN